MSVLTKGQEEHEVFEAFKGACSICGHEAVDEYAYWSGHDQIRVCTRWSCAQKIALLATDAFILARQGSREAVEIDMKEATRWALLCHERRNKDPLLR